MNKLDLLKLAEQQDVEAFEGYEFEETITQKEKLKKDYLEFYNDVKQPSKYIKEDW